MVSGAGCLPLEDKKSTLPVRSAGGQAVPAVQHHEIERGCTPSRLLHRGARLGAGCCQGAGELGSGSTGVFSAARCGTPVLSGQHPIIGEMRLLALPALLGIWETASLLRGSVAVTAAFTLGAALLGAWAIAVLREG